MNTNMLRRRLDRLPGGGCAAPAASAVSAAMCRLSEALAAALARRPLVVCELACGRFIDYERSGLSESAVPDFAHRVADGEATSADLTALDALPAEALCMVGMTAEQYARSLSKVHRDF